MAADKVGEIWDALLAVPGVKPAGLGARDTLRLEMGYPLYGHEMDTETTPIEAGFGQMLKLEDGRDFAGACALRATPPSKHLVGIVLDGRRATRHGAAVCAVDGAVIGKITSGTFSPSLEKAIALAYINVANALKPGDEMVLDAGGKKIPGKVAKTPFHTAGTARIKIC